MKRYLKALLMIALAVVVVIIVSAKPLKSKADTETITRVDLAYDMDKIPYNSHYTVAELTQDVRKEIDKNKSIYGTGTGVYFDRLNTHLSYWSSSGQWMSATYTGDNVPQMSVSEAPQLGLCYNIKLEPAYSWPEEAKVRTESPITVCPNLQVYVNGVRRTDLSFYYNLGTNAITFSVPFTETISTKHVVKSLTVQENISMKRGTSKEISYDIVASHYAVEGVKWSILEMHSRNTTISENGVLHVSSSESANTLTVRATSVWDSTKYADCVVSIFDTDPGIDSVSINAPAEKYYPGHQYTFTSVVEGDHENKNVIWEISGNTAVNTTISSNGVLSISDDETAGEIEVKAISAVEVQKFETYTANICPNATVTDFYINCDFAKLGLKYGAIENSINQNSQYAISIDTEGAWIASSVAVLMRREDDGFKAAQSQTDPIVRTKQYAIRVRISHNEFGYVFSDALTARIKSGYTIANDVTEAKTFVNGQHREDVYYSYSYEWDEISVYIPVDDVLGGIKPTELALSEATLTLPTCQEYILEAMLSPSKSTSTISWTSSNPSTLTVQDGKLTALKYSSTPVTITATTDNGLKATCTVQTRYFDAPSNTGYPGKYIYWAADKGITNGYDGVYFGVGEECTRESFAIFLWRYAGKPTAKSDIPFNDCEYAKTTSAYKAIAWCAEKGIVKGYADGGYHPQANIARKDVMIMLYRYMGKPKVTGTMTFPDCTEYSTRSDTYNAILWGVQKKITAGYEDGTFRPNDNCLREQMVTFLYRL